jgi:ankyrin repeat protein
MASACYGRVEIAQILLDYGVDQKAKDSKGFTAADFARKMNKKSILKLLEFDKERTPNTGYAR